MKQKNIKAFILFFAVIAITLTAMPFMSNVVLASSNQEEDILKKADERKNDIRNSPTTVNVPGTKYYVSNKGNDSNDGQSPERPWATLDKVNSASLKPGDGVFFKRGDLWRNQHLEGQKGVTYSAYGTGQKPRFYMSPENGTGANKWTLVPGTTNIWVFYKELRDCGMIIFNDGEKNAHRIVPAYKNGKAVEQLNTKNAFDFIKVLKDDLDFYSELPPLSEWEFDVNPNREGGMLYLRCDEGNPGIVFKSIEFSTAGDDSVKHWEYRHLIFAHEGSVFDNLCLMYCSYHAISVVDTNNVTTQNCEIGWIGGGIQTYRPIYELKTDDEYYPIGFGNGVELYGFGTGLYVLNNYIHHIYDAGASNQSVIYRDTPPQKEINMHYIGNVFTHCNYGIELWIIGDMGDVSSVRAIKNSYMKDVRIDDNYFMYSGYIDGYDNSRSTHNEAICMGGNNVDVTDFSIQNNVFYLAKEKLLEMSVDMLKVKIDRNTYVQHNNEIFFSVRDKSDNRAFYTFDLSSLDDIIKNKLGDKNAIIPALSASQTATDNDNTKDDWIAPSDLSSWAVSDVQAAITLGIATDELQKDYKSNTTRGGFCRAAINFLEIYYKKNISDILKERNLISKTFADTLDKAIAAAAALGITSGTDTAKNLFSPDIELTREQAATMLKRTIDVIGAKIDAKAAVWIDAADISNWAVDSINAIYTAGIMSGTSTTSLVFSPKSPYTHEQSIVTFNRLYSYIDKLDLEGTGNTTVIETPESETLKDETPKEEIPNPLDNIEALKSTVKKGMFNAAAKAFYNRLPDDAKNDMVYNRLLVNDIEFIEQYRNDGKEKPVMFVIHGGGGKKEDVLGTVDWYAHEGFYAIALDVAAHGESSRGTLVNIDAWVETVGYIDTLIEYANTQKQADATRFGVGGGSMGGTITFLYGVIGKYKPSVLLPEIGAPDLTQILNGKANGITDRGRGTGVELVTDELAKKVENLSAINNIEKFIDIPMYARFGSEDYENGSDGARLFIEKLKKAGGSIQNLTIVEGYGHGGFPDDGGAQIQYMKKYLGME